MTGENVKVRAERKLGGTVENHPCERRKAPGLPVKTGQASSSAVRGVSWTW